MQSNSVQEKDRQPRVFGWHWERLIILRTSESPITKETAHLSRRQARTAYLAITKQRQPKRKKLRKAIRQQFGYVQ